MFKITFLVLFLSLFIFSASAYGQTDNLQGVWMLHSFTENGNNIPLSFTENGNNIPLVGNRPVEKKILAELRLTKDSFSITPACNSNTGKYKIVRSGRLKFTPRLTTVKGCSREADEMDRRLVAVLSKVVKYKIKNKVLTLQDATGQNALIFNYSPARNQPRKQKGNLLLNKKPATSEKVLEIAKVIFKTIKFP